MVKVFTSGVDGDQWFYAMELVEGATLAAVSRVLQARSSSAVGLDLATWQESLSQACVESRKEEESLSDPHLGVSKPVPPRGESEQATARLPSPARRGYVNQVAELVRQVSLGTCAAPGGVIHRDIKPSNVVVTADGTQAVLMDLGLAQLGDEIGQKNNANLTTKFVGTLRYASPEQILDSAKVDRRTDVYSLGGMLWELLTLRPLYGATESTPDYVLQRQIVLDEPRRVRVYHPGIPRDLEAIVAKCLEKKRNDRYATAAELAEDLRRFRAGEPVQARPVGVLGRTLRWGTAAGASGAGGGGVRSCDIAGGNGLLVLGFSPRANRVYHDFENGGECRWGSPASKGSRRGSVTHDAVPSAGGASGAGRHHQRIWRADDAAASRDVHREPR